MIGYQLGQQVVYQKHIIRRGFREQGLDAAWGTEQWPGRPTDGGAGIIVGKRTLSNGNIRVSYGYDGETVYEPKEHFQAYMVAFDLRRKPVFVLPKHLTPLEIPIGTKVRYWPGVRDGYEGKISTTRTNVWELCGTPVVCVDGYAGGIALSHIQIQEKEDDNET